MPVPRTIPAGIIAGILTIGCQPAQGPVISPLPASPPEAVALVAEMDRIVAGVWPGFDTRATPVAIFDGTRTWLVRHPSPPTGFAPVDGRTDVVVFDGRFPAVTANSSARIGGVATATVMPSRSAASMRERAAVLAHETFHVHQRRQHPTWSANEVELFTYPAADAHLLALRRLESEALRRALSASSRGASRCWTDVALRLRHERFTGLTVGAAAYERTSELNEGLANYVQWRAAGASDSTVMPPGEFPPDGIRHRVYSSGAALAMLLDRFSPEWKSALVQNDTLHLDALLQRAVATQPGDSGCAFSAAEIQLVRTSAAAAVNELNARRNEAKSAFLRRPGWTLVVAARPVLLFPQGFDPLNVQNVSHDEVLHSRFLKLGNDAGAIEILGRAALTEGTGTHPLFNGVRAVTIAGLADEPSLSDSAGRVVIRGDGVAGEFAGAAVQRSGRTITIELRSVR